MASELTKISKLIVKISRHDEKALEELFNLTKEKLYYLACKYLNDVSLANDVLSEVYLKVYENAKSFDKKKNGFNWLHTIVKNQAFDFNKSEKRYSSEEFKEEFYVSGSYASKSDNTRVKYLRLAMNYLSPKEEKIVRLKFWENCTLKEISNEMGIPISTLHRIYTNSIKKLNRLMTEMERGDNDVKK